MNKLIKADFARLFKSRIFWFGSMFMIITSLYFTYHYVQNMKYAQIYVPTDGIFSEGADYIYFITALLIGNFVGKDFAYNTIRNKIAVGYTKKEIYLSDLIVCLSASAAIYAVKYIIFLGAESLGFIRKFEMSYETIFKMIICSFIFLLAFWALIIFICTLSANIALSLAISLILAYEVYDSSFFDMSYPLKYLIFALAVTSGGLIIFTRKDLK